MDQEVILTPSLAIERIKETLKFRDRYDNFIGGKWVKPQDGSYFDNITPISGTKLGSVARSKAADIELAIDAAHKSQETWSKKFACGTINIVAKSCGQVGGEFK